MRWKKNEDDVTDGHPIIEAGSIVLALLAVATFAALLSWVVS